MGSPAQAVRKAGAARDAVGIYSFQGDSQRTQVPNCKFRLAVDTKPSASLTCPDCCGKKTPLYIAHWKYVTPKYRLRQGAAWPRTWTAADLGHCHCSCPWSHLARCPAKSLSSRRTLRYSKVCLWLWGSALQCTCLAHKPQHTGAVIVHSNRLSNLVSCKLLESHCSSHHWMLVVAIPDCQPSCLTGRNLC